MATCFAADCNHNSYREKCSFFRFPKENNKLKTWIKLCRRADRDPSSTSRLCSCHFKDGRKENGPTIFPRNEGKFFQFISPEKKTSKRRKKVSISEESAFTSALLPEPPSQREDVHFPVGFEEVEISPSDVAIDTLKAEMNSLKAENLALQSEVRLLATGLHKAPSSPRMTFKSIAEDQQLVYYYTGLPDVIIFNLVFSWCTLNNFNYYEGWSVEIIDQRDQLCLTLMKLRLNLDVTDLAFRFQVSKRTVSVVFLTWLHLLHEVLFKTTMNVLPSTAKNRRVLPNSFSQFTNCRVVVDCTEVQCCVPRSSMIAQSQTYSHYKSRNTFKGLVGVAPNGVITFMSDLYPGSCSDKEIFCLSGIAEQFVAGDLVLADKGFLIQDCVPSGVSVNIPPFLDKGQFTKEEVKVTKNIARARIHVERAIGRMKNFNILLYFPTHLRCYSTLIFQVCGCLVNLQNPLIQLDDVQS